MTQPRTVIVTSSDRLFAEVVADWLDGLEGWRATAALDGVRALAAIRRSPPHAVLLLGDPGRVDPEALTQQIRRRWPMVAVVAVGARVTQATALPAQADADDLLQELALGHVPVSPPRPEEPDGIALLATLTARERRTLRLLAAGASNREIADVLDISVNTARTHTQNVYTKLGCHNRLEIVRFAARFGLLPPGRGNGA